jgi:hypothetical protein
MKIYKVDYFNPFEDGEAKFKSTEEEKALYGIIGEVMYDANQILGIWRFDIETNQVDRGEVKWDEDRKQFEVIWELAWQA